MALTWFCVRGIVMYFRLMLSGWSTTCQIIAAKTGRIAHAAARQLVFVHVFFQFPGHKHRTENTFWPLDFGIYEVKRSQRTYNKSEYRSWFLRRGFRMAKKSKPPYRNFDNAPVKLNVSCSILDVSCSML